MKLTLKNHKVISWNKLYSSPHWAIRKQLADDIHKMMYYECKAQKMKVVKKYPVTLTFIAIQKGKVIDNSNVCVKLYEDGLKVAGIIKDDTPAYISPLLIDSRKGKEDRIEIYLT